MPILIHFFIMAIKVGIFVSIFSNFSRLYTLLTM